MEKYGIAMNVKLPIEILKRERWYVASCPALDVASQGETIKKAKDNLSEAVSLFLISCLERGRLEQVLKLRRTKQALMQDLLTGRVRVPEKLLEATP